MSGMELQIWLLILMAWMGSGVGGQGGCAGEISVTHSGMAFIY